VNENIEDIIADKALPNLTGDQFLQIRKACNFTRSEGGEYLSYDKSTIFKWEKNTNKITDDAVDIIIPRLMRRLEQVIKNARYWHQFLVALQIDRKKAKR